MRSFSDMVAFTCQKLTSDSRRVTSASPVAVLNLPDATCIPDIGWKKMVHVQIVSAQIVSGTNCIGTNCIGTICIGTICIGHKLYRAQTVSGTNCIL
jgi:hypothetical protein